MLRTASSLPPKGLSTLGSGPARFQTKPPACYRASWQLPGPDFHRQATTSLRTRGNTMHYVTVHLLFCWAHEKTSVTRVSALSAAQGPGPGFHGRDTRPGSATMVPGTGKGITSPTDVIPRPGAIPSPESGEPDNTPERNASHGKARRQSGLHHRRGPRPGPQ